MAHGLSLVRAAAWPSPEGIPGGIVIFYIIRDEGSGTRNAPRFP